MEAKKAFKIFHYMTQLRWTGERRGELASHGKPTLEIAAPPEFKGHPGRWTPEDLFVAAVDICTMTTFLAFAAHKKLGLVLYQSTAEGTLENVEGKYQFTQVTVSPHVTVATEEEIPAAEQILRDVEASCLISNSITAHVEIQAVIQSEAASLKPLVIV